MAERHVSAESWYLAFTQEEERQRMRDTGRQLFSLAIQYMSRTRGHEPILVEGQRIARYYGQQCAQYQISLVDTVRALSFFRESLFQAIKPGMPHRGALDAEDLRIQNQLDHFLDKVMYSCLESFEAACLARNSHALDTAQEQ
jgi:hypothetical protein